MTTIAQERKKFADKYRRFRKQGKTREARAHWKLDLRNGPIGHQAMAKALYGYGDEKRPNAFSSLFARARPCKAGN